MQKRTQRSLLLVAVLAASAAAQPALAEGLYVGGNVGKPDLKADSINGQVGDSHGAGYKLYGGWQFRPNFALEVGGTGLGKFGDNGRAYGGFADAVGIWPINSSWSALGRVGVAHMKVKAGGASDTATVPKLGLGAQYNLSKNTAVRAEWERYRLDAFGAKSNADLYSLGMNVSF